MAPKKKPAPKKTFKKEASEAVDKMKEKKFPPKK